MADNADGVADGETPVVAEPAAAEPAAVFGILRAVPAAAVVVQEGPTTIAVGDRVRLAVTHNTGIVAFVGNHVGTDTERIGIKLDTPTGYHDGTVGGHQYFDAAPNHGVLVVPMKVEVLVQAKDVRVHNHDSAGDAGRRRDVIEVGDLVETVMKGRGIVKYNGPSNIVPKDVVQFVGRRPSLYTQEVRHFPIVIGIELNEPLGTHGGTTEDGTYFTCKQGHGYLAVPEKVTLITKGIDLEDEHRAKILAGIVPVGAEVSDPFNAVKDGVSDRDRVEKNADQEKASRAQKAEDRKARDAAKKSAKEAAKQGEADRKAALKAQKKQEKEDKRAAVKAERERKIEGAAAIKASESANKWEKNKATKLEREMMELIQAEDAKFEQEEREAGKQEAKDALVARFNQPGPESRVPSDQTLGRRKKGSLKKSNDGVTVVADFGGSDFKPQVVKSNGALVLRDTLLQDKYLAKNSYLKTLNRPVGGKKKLFEQKNDGLKEDQKYLAGEMVNTLLYVEAFKWSFNNEETAATFVEVLKNIRESDYQAEAYYNAMELPATADIGDGKKFNYLTVAVGTVEQYKQFHSTYDIRALVNAAVTPHTANSAGIKSVTGNLFCARKSAVLEEVAKDWNKSAYCDIAVQPPVRKLNLPGGWATVARYINDNRNSADSNDLMINIATFQGSKGAVASLKNQLEIFYLEYQGLAPQLAQSAVFNGWTSPIDFAVDVTTNKSEPKFITVSFSSSSLWLRAKAKAGATTKADMAGMTLQEMYFTGPGAYTPAMVEYTAGLNGLGVDGLAAVTVAEVL